MQVLVTGGAGFLGSRLVAALLERGGVPGPDGRLREVDRVVVADVGPPARAFPDDARLETVYGDFSAEGAAARLLREDTGVVFHLAAVVSGEAEKDFDKGMRVNLHGTERLLEACRRGAHCPTVVFASSVAAYGGDMPEVIRDDTALTPLTSYGTQKAMGELLVNDYTRKGFVDGRALRLPTIVVRPGKPNAAASSFASSVIREPLQGEAVVCPVAPETGVWLLSPRRVIEAFLHAAASPAEAWGPSRSVALPGLTLSVRDMLAALARVAGDEVAKRVRFEPDPFIEAIVYGWATRFAPERALALGFRADESFESVIEAFIEDELGGKVTR
ncbi:MAG: D-erythronate dehydrogenase [Gammaproteobacteria bacterium]|nr:D-erythronate dehydrogenase [Gammaproteobacteria bacterium]